MASPAQLRAARALIGLSEADLAERAGVSVAALQRAEADGEHATSDVAVGLRRALELSGACFLDAGATSDRGGAGVRLKLKPDEGLRPDQLTTENDD